ncbi:MAG TPA: hypothetical protein VFX03_07780 [Thermomicrobiales bacterium]|nr:hypothetical protein [Thermomicrobiales bacterium]
MSAAPRNRPSFGDRIVYGLYGFLLGIIVGIILGWQFRFVVGAAINVLAAIVLVIVIAAGYMVYQRFSNKRAVQEAVQEQAQRDRAAIDAASQVRRDGGERRA